MRFGRSILAGILTPALAFASAAQATNWVKIADAKTVTVYMDRDSIQPSGRFLLAWIKWEFKVPFQGSAQDKDRDAFDCVQRTYRFLATIHYHADGTSFGSSEWSINEGTDHPAAPDTMAARELDFVCAAAGNSPPPG